MDLDRALNGHTHRLRFRFPAEFSIWTREAGAGGLSIAMEGPSRAEISFDDRKDGSCGVSYIAQEPGRAPPPPSSPLLRPPPSSAPTSPTLPPSPCGLSLSDPVTSALVRRRLRDLGQVQRAAHPRQPVPGARGGAGQRRSAPHCYRPSGEARGDTAASRPGLLRLKGSRGAVA